LTHRPRLLTELATLAAVIAALGIVSFVAQRLLIPRRPAAPDLGRSMDSALGPLILRQVELSQRVLDDRAVNEAFSKIMDRLRPGLEAMAPGSPKVRIVVLDSPEVNSFALPGGIICVYTGLMRELGSAEQMAAILSHELSHVAHRDPLALLARRVGVAALVGLLTGGRGGDLSRTIAQTLVNVSYGREAEDRADAFAVELLARSDIAPSSFAGALEAIRKAEPKDPGLLVWIDTHSPIQQRIARAAEQASKLSVTPRRIPVDWRRIVRGLPKSRE
jgi:predicted Zn-dependent protease